MNRHRGIHVATALLVAPLLLAAGLAVAPTAALTPASSGAPAQRAPALTNLDHLDWLGDSVIPPQQAGHTTYRLATAPAIGTLWTYADRQDDGSYLRVGGGTYAPETNTYGQGAFNADDMTRAAVVYLRHWQSTGDAGSREHAYELLRGVAYLQTVTPGPDAGNVVLWMQPDGTLNPSADPPELPDPSDSDASYWLARTIWALGEGYEAFRHEDPAFARFLGRRLDLAVAAIDRQVLDRYGSYLRIDGRRAPAWLIVDGADASAEAVLGLSAYVAAGGPAPARRALRQLSEGIAALAGGDAQTWPFGAVRPSALSRSVWHAWGSQMPGALGRAAVVLDRTRPARVAARDSFTFDPWLLTSGGPDNGRQPTASDLTQIAYGIDSRLQSLVATGEARRSAAVTQLAGMTAAWYFGANASGAPVYDPDTGRTYDGVAGDGTINVNSGAESTIHGLLSMLALDAHPRIALLARTATVERRIGARTLQAEDGVLSGDATIVIPESTWTDEAEYGGTGYVAIGSGGTVEFDVSVRRQALLLPVVDLQPSSTALTSFASGDRRLGRVDSGDIGAQGDSPALGALLPVTLGRTLPGLGERDARTITATTRHAGSDPARLDALIVQPLVSRLVLRGQGHGTALIASASRDREHTRIAVPGRGEVRVSIYDGLGRLIALKRARGSTVFVQIPPGGFAVARR